MLIYTSIFFKLCNKNQLLLRQSNLTHLLISHQQFCVRFTYFVHSEFRVSQTTLERRVVYIGAREISALERIERANPVSSTWRSTDKNWLGTRGVVIDTSHTENGLNKNGQLLPLVYIYRGGRWRNTVALETRRRRSIRLNNKPQGRSAVVCESYDYV